MARPFVIAFCNRKGGSGKTTTAVNLAAEDASRGHRTLLVDLDTQGHAGLGVGVSPKGAAFTVHRIFDALAQVGLLPVMVNTRVNFQKTMLGRAAEQYGADRLLTSIRSDIVLAEAVAAGQPVRTFAPRARGALDYHLLAKEIAALWQWTAPPASRRGAMELCLGAENNDVRAGWRN